MNTIQKLGLILLGLTTLTLSGCNDDDTPAAASRFSTLPALLVVNEGNPGSNNTTLSYLDALTGEVQSEDFFLEASGRALGDNANSIVRYGGKLYITVTESGTVEVLDARTGEVLGTVALVTTGTPNRKPREAVGAAGLLWVTAFSDEVVAIDTQSLAVTGTAVAVGRDPEGIALANGKLYVACSGGLDFPNFDNRVFVINPATRAVLKQFAVNLNPVQMLVDAEGEVYVRSNGDFGVTTGAQLQAINTTTDTVQLGSGYTNLTLLNPDYVAISGSVGYVLEGAFSANPIIKRLDLNSELVDDADWADLSDVTSPYALVVNVLNGGLFVLDAEDFVSSGQVFAYPAAGGQPQWSASTGTNPGEAAVLP